MILGKKEAKKLLAGVLSMSMVFSLSATVWAEERDGDGRNHPLCSGRGLYR